MYVWEAKGGYHVHCLINLPKCDDAIRNLIQSAFKDMDIDIKRLWDRRGAQAYLLKGTDAITHAKIFGRCRLKAKNQAKFHGSDAGGARIWVRRLASETA